MGRWRLLAAIALGLGAKAFAGDDVPIRIVGGEGQQLDFARTDGGLAPVAGLRTQVVFRADQDDPLRSDGRGWTYHHHPDLAGWQHRLYVAWSSCQCDEDTWPCRELYSTSLDGVHWSAPQELFPEGVSTPLRVYFYRSAGGRLLALAGLRLGHERTSERTKGPLVVREVHADHTLGPVYTLRAPVTPAPQPPPYAASADLGFVDACRQLLADHLFLEQQDYGALLDPADRMPWHDPEVWAGDAELRKDATDFGKALSFYQRGDGSVVGVGKKGWVTVSGDSGVTWTQPVRPPTLVTGMGKVWGQQTPSGAYVLVYNPDRRIRYPLAVVTGRDGVTYGAMRATHGQLPVQRYPGRNKDRGASYVRGLSRWSDDGTFRDDGVWLVYSVNKEEIWVSRLPDTVTPAGAIGGPEGASGR